MTLQALFDKLKSSHLELKDKVKELCRHCASSAELTTFKCLLLQFPPLHSLNDILDEMSTTPNMKMLRSTASPRKYGTPQTTAGVKRRASTSAGGCPLKSLKFSPHLFKKEPTSDSKDYSPNGRLDLAGVADSYKGEEDEDIIEIDGV